MKVLVIEDEPDMMAIIRQSLEREHFLVETADTYRQALNRVVSYDYDCILLDINLPGGSGLDLLAEIRRMGKSDSVIIISARDSIEDKVQGLHLGADDYLAKPFHIAELHARIRSVLRRRVTGGAGQTIELGRLLLNFEDRTVRVAGEPLSLNRKEFDILAFFAANKGRLVTRTSLAEHVWGDHADESDDFEFLYSQIKNLRRKLRESESGLEIQAVYGVGYRLAAL